MRFNRGADLRFHLACASVRTHLLLKARQSCRDNLTRMRSASLLDSRSYGRGAGGSCIRGLKKSGVKPPHSVKERGSAELYAPKAAAATENIRVN